MNFVYKYVNKVPVISFRNDDGSLLGADIKAFGEEVLSLMAEGGDRIVFDLRGNSYLNSFGLGELINIRKFFDDRHVNCILIADSLKITKLLDMVGLSELFNIVKDEKEI